MRRGSDVRFGCLYLRCGHDRLQRLLHQPEQRRGKLRRLRRALHRRRGVQQRYLRLLERHVLFRKVREHQRRFEELRQLRRRVPTADARWERRVLVNTEQSTPPPSSMAPRRRGPRYGFTMASSAAVGAVAGVASIFLASWLAKLMGQTPDPIVAGGRLGVPGGGLVLAALGGAAAGVVLGLCMINAARLVARAIFAPVSSCAVYFCVHTLLLQHRAPTLPLVPMLVGTGLFGLCLACAPPFDRLR
jgi:hypothetical protein